MFKMLPLVVLSSFFLTAFGHVQLAEPCPFRSTLNPSPPGPVDYNMLSPLKPDGSDFPCKGYHKDIDSTPVVEEYKAGSQYTMKLSGGATHAGGSCQISLSYDKGQTFHVIHSMIGGCPLNTAYQFTIPSNAPSCDKAIFAWSWVNKVGNREFYMNCAAVKITGSSSGTTLNTPLMFEANIFNGKCQTPESVDFVYPNPGDSVEYGGQYATQKPSGPTEISGCPSLDNADSPPSPPSQDVNNTVVNPPVEVPSASATLQYTPTSPNAISKTPDGQYIPTSSPNAISKTPDDGQYHPPTSPTGTPVGQYQPPISPTGTPVGQYQPPTSTTGTPVGLQQPAPTTGTPVGLQQPSATVVDPAIEKEVVYMTVTKTNVDYMTRPRTSPTGTPTASDESAVETCDEPGVITCSSDGKTWRFCDYNQHWQDMTCGENERCKNGKLVPAY